jgi:hypothetical protein
LRVVGHRRRFSRPYCNHDGYHTSN